MTRTEYKAQNSNTRKAQRVNPVEKAITRNARKQFARFAPAVRAIAKQIRRECEAVATHEDILMAL